MEKRTLLGVATILLILYTGGVILNPHLRADKKTVFIEGNMDCILDVSAYEAPISDETRDNGLEVHFEDPVSTVFLRLNRSVLDAEPNRVRFDMAILSSKELIVNVSMTKVLDLSPRKNQTVGKPYSFSSNESSFIYLRVWQLKGERDETSEATYTDRIQLRVVTPYTPGEKTDNISGIVLHSFRYVYYTEEGGKRGAPLSLGLREFFLYYVPFILALFIPFFIFIKRNWGDFFT